jgi:hypothetical protein
MCKRILFILVILLSVSLAYGCTEAEPENIDEVVTEAPGEATGGWIPDVDQVAPGEHRVVVTGDVEVDFTGKGHWKPHGGFGALQLFYDSDYYANGDFLMCGGLPCNAPVWLGGLEIDKPPGVYTIGYYHDPDISGSIGFSEYAEMDKKYLATEGTLELLSSNPWTGTFEFTADRAGGDGVVTVQGAFNQVQEISSLE